MRIQTRAALDTDKAACIKIEQAAIAGIRYIDDVWQLFTRESQGELTVALADGSAQGMGKLTRLYGGFGWLESLRVHPLYQGKGLGKAIYARYLEQVAAMGLTAIGMYTGVDNAVSRGLAEQHGLAVKGRFAEFLAPPPEGVEADFIRVSADRGEQLLSPCYRQMEPFAVVNRTWYPVGPGLGRHLAANGWLFADGAGSLLVAGARFQPEKLLHLPYLEGDVEKCLAFAGRLCKERGCGRISGIRPWQDDKSAALLTGHGFIRQPEAQDHITLWTAGVE